MSDEALKKLEEIEKKIDYQNIEIKEIKSYIGNRDRVRNQEYCDLRGMKLRTLKTWFAIEDDPCPRKDYRHVSIKEVDEWIQKRNTRVKVK